VRRAPRLVVRSARGPAMSSVTSADSDVGRFPRRHPRPPPGGAGRVRRFEIGRLHLQPAGRVRRRGRRTTGAAARRVRAALDPARRSCFAPSPFCCPCSRPRPSLRPPPLLRPPRRRARRRRSRHRTRPSPPPPGAADHRDRGAGGLRVRRSRRAHPAPARPHGAPRPGLGPPALRRAHLPAHLRGTRRSPPRSREAAHARGELGARELDAR
jgi:hypothetical protein